MFGLTRIVVTLSALTLGLLVAAAPALAQPSLAPLKRDDAPSPRLGSTAGTKKLSDVISSIKEFTINDLTAAAEDAESQPCDDDPAKICPDESAKCWRTLIPYVTVQQNPLPKGLGVAQAIQKARDLQRRVAAGVPDPIKRDCGIVLWDAESALLKFGLKFTPFKLAAAKQASRFASVPRRSKGRLATR